MRKTNKILSLMLALCMMLSLAMPLAANAATITFSDVTSEHVYYEAITNLAAEGILNGFEDGTFKPEEPVTRAQFTKIICYALDSGDLKYGENQRVSFPDVDPNHWAIDNITTAYNSKIINGYDDGTFKPENSVLYEQAVKMAVCALGYPQERAERSGGYPNGYIKIASDIKMLKRLVDVKIGEPLTRGGVAQLIDNMRDADIYSEVTNPSRPGSSQTGGGTLRENATSTTQKQQIDGRIVAVYGSTIYPNEVSKCNRQQIELLVGIQRIFFGIENLGISDTSDYLGRSVTVYYVHDSSATYDEATNIIFQNKKNKEIEVRLDDIEGVVGSKLEYYSEKDQDVVDVDLDLANMSVILNGIAVSDSFATVLANAGNKSGYVTLVCSQSDTVVDLAFVKTYDTIVVGSKDTTKYKVYNYYKYTGARESVLLDETDLTKTITIKRDGKPVTFASIANYDILSVSESGDGSLVDALISKTTKKGTISEVIGDDRIKLSNDETIYKLANCCKEYRDASNDNDKIAAGAYVTLYLDAFGTVARYVLSAEKTYTFGYITAVEEGTMTNPKVDVMVYKTSTSSAKATPVKYTLKDNVRIDDQAYSVSKNYVAILDALKSAASNKQGNIAINGATPYIGIDDEGNEIPAEYSQPIRFTTSSSNVIDSILTSKKTGEFNVSMNITDHMTTPLTCHVDGTTLGEYSISGVPVLVIPTNRMSDDYATRNSSYFKKGTQYYVQAANVSSSKKPAALYVYVSEAQARESLTEDHIPMIVTETTTVSYENDTRICLKLMGTDGVTTEVYDDGREGTGIISSLQAGDVIRVAADDMKLVDAIELLASASGVIDGTQQAYFKQQGATIVKGDDGNEDPNELYLDAPFRVILGIVETAVSNNLVIKPTFDKNENKVTENYTNSEGVKLFLVEPRATNKLQIVRECVFDEIVGYRQQPDNASKVMVYTADGKVKAMIVFKGQPQTGTGTETGTETVEE